MLKSGNKIQTSITKTNNYSKSNPVSFSIKSKTTKTNYPFSISNNAVNIINNNKDKIWNFNNYHFNNIIT